MLTLLMTRPQSAAERFVAGLPDDLRARITPVYSPLIGIEPITHDIHKDGARGLIFTSANGVEVAAGLTSQRDLPCYCIGTTTTKTALGAGWSAENVGDNAEALISTLQNFCPPGPLLHLRGRHARGDVAARLTTLGCLTREQVIYDQPLLPFSDSARQVLAAKTPLIALLFSPRTARQFAKLVTGHAKLFIGTLSESVAEPVKTIEYNQLAVSLRPNAHEMMLVMTELINSAIRVEGLGRTQ